MKKVYGVINVLGGWAVYTSEGEFIKGGFENIGDARKFIDNITKEETK